MAERELKPPGTGGVDYGEFERAIEAYRASIADRPTAEAHTFLGWSLRDLGCIGKAIAHCKIAIVQ